MKLVASLLAFGVVSAIADVCLASICYHDGVSVCFRSCVISAIPVQVSWMLYSLLKCTAHLCLGQESWPLLCEAAHSWRATTVWSWSQPSMAAVRKLNKSLSRYVCAVIIFSLGLVRLAVGWALQLPALAENESLVGCCISQSTWELLGSVRNNGKRYM